MARAYASASSQYHEIASAVATVAPFTMACWGYAAATGVAAQVVMALGTSVTTVGRHILYFGGTSFTANNSVVAQSVSNDGVTAGSAITSTTYAATTWTHLCGVWTSTASRTAYINGGSAVTETTTVAPTGLDRTNLGTRWNTTRGLFLNGRLAECGIWNVALTADEVATLAAGYSPLFVRPTALVGYWPLFARGTNEEQWSGVSAFVPTNTPTATQHPPRIIYPSRPRIIIPAAAAASTTYPQLERGIRGMNRGMNMGMAA